MFRVRFARGNNPAAQEIPQEWLDTNGLGGYASSTLSHCHTRKYHGLFVSASDRPPPRTVLLSKFDEILYIKDKIVHLSSHQYPGLLFSPDNDCLVSFVQSDYPRFVYHVGPILLHKDVMWLHEENTLLLRYRLLRCPGPARLLLRPFIAFRRIHDVVHENEFIQIDAVSVPNGFQIRPYEGMPPLFLQWSGEGLFSSEPLWYRAFEYLEEFRRGYAWQEDLFQPGWCEISLQEGKDFFFSLSVSPFADAIRERWRNEEKSRREEATKRRRCVQPTLKARDLGHVLNLMRAADQFLVRGPEGRTAIVAGYHWFEVWGRDTLIALPGLTFCCGRIQQGMDILRHLGQYEWHGLLPNVLAADREHCAYNAVDVSLWFFWAVQQLVRHGGNYVDVQRYFWPLMKRILSCYAEGTVHQIGMDSSGLLHAGDPSTQLTWMDASIKGQPVTPRWGYTVEINALWYNALAWTQELAQRFGESCLVSKQLLDRVKKSFLDAFWLEQEGYLADCVHDGLLDQSIRPNQVIAVSLPHTCLDKMQAERLLAVIGSHLLTPRGLRSLSPHDKSYRGFCVGNQEQRDSAYHQGTVWPWLLGPYGEALLKTAADIQQTRKRLLDYLHEFLSVHFYEAGIGSVSEIFDGDPPHSPRGCIAQAWSVAELLRLYTLLGKNKDVV